MDIHEVAVREAICLLCIFGSLIVDSQMPFRIFTKAMLLDERVFLLRGRLILTPRVSFVPDRVVLLDQSLCVLERGVV